MFLAGLLRFCSQGIFFFFFLFQTSVSYNLTLVSLEFYHIDCIFHWSVPASCFSRFFSACKLLLMLEIIGRYMNLFSIIVGFYCEGLEIPGHCMSRKNQDGISSDDEQQDSHRGRSKLERWTSHKENISVSTSPLLP
jgi:hypothetical protein